MFCYLAGRPLSVDHVEIGLIDGKEEMTSGLSISPARAVLLGRACGVGQEQLLKTLEDMLISALDQMDFKVGGGGSVSFPI